MSKLLELDKAEEGVLKTLSAVAERVWRRTRSKADAKEPYDNQNPIPWNLERLRSVWKKQQREKPNCVKVADIKRVKKKLIGFTVAPLDKGAGDGMVM